MQASNIRQFPRRPGFRSPVSRRRCKLRTGNGDLMVVLRSVSAAGAFVEIEGTVALDASVVLMHPEAGQISAQVARVGREGAALTFDVGPQATTFALAAMCADMTVRASEGA